MKKTLTFSFLFLAFVALTVTSTFGYVLDTDGNQVVAGIEYYIIPSVSGNGGGLRLEITSCPSNLTIVQVPDESNNGSPVIFSPVNSTEGTAVPLFTDSNIHFSVFTICIQSTVWKITVDSSSGQRFVTGGGVVGNPGAQTLSNWFKVQQFEDAYKLVFCPTVCDLCRPFCGELSLEKANEDGLRRVMLGRDPFKVVFKKVN